MRPAYKIWLAMLWSFVCGLNIVSAVALGQFTFAAVAVLNGGLAIAYGWQATAVFRAPPQDMRTE